MRRSLREDFPYAEQCVYLNTASAGLSFRGQGDAAASFYDGPKAQGMNGMAEWRIPADEARGRIARLVGVNMSDVRFAASTTEGLYLSLGAIPFKDGDEIVVAADEFPSVLAACECAPRAAVSVKKVPITDEASRERALLAAMTTKTRALAVSHVHWVTGTRIYLDRVSEACARTGATLVVDGVQALGAVPVKVPPNAIYSASVFKWLLSGFGLAVMIVGTEVGEGLAPAVRGYNNAPPSVDLQYAHINYPGIAALNASLSYMEAFGWADVHAAVDARWRETRDGMSRLGLRVVTPADAHAGILSAEVHKPAPVRDALAEQQVFVEQRGGLLRVSPHFYNTSDHIGSFFERLSPLIR